MRRLRALLGFALAAPLAAGCGGPGRTRAEAPPEVLVEVLPRTADVTLDGRPVGRGGGVVPAPPAGEHVLAVAAEGYEPVERRLEEEDLAGARVAEALRPVGFEAPRAVHYDDAEALALAAAFLAEEGAPADAAAYAERALVLAPGLPLAHRALGDAALRAGDRRRAAAAYAEYLRLAPDAPDAARVAERLDDARGEARR